MARILGRVRLSRTTEESTSEERQREVIESWAKMHGHEIVGWAVDMDVSGSLSPFDTPQLGDWLQRPHEWDIIVAWKLDRLGRTLFGLNRLFEWVLEQGKTLVCVDDRIDLGHWTGRMVASVIAGVAEGELENIRARVAASQAHLRRQGKWHGGAVPFGYQAVKTDDGWQWEINEDEAKYIREMARRVIAGESASAVARWLESEGVKARRSQRWSYTAVTRILRSRWVLGQRTHDSRWRENQRRASYGHLVLGDDGMPLQFAEPILDENVWEAVQVALDKSGFVRSNANGVGLLRDVGFCVCGRKLYHWVTRKDRGKGIYRYWRCSGKIGKDKQCEMPNIPAELLEDYTAERFLSDVGHIERSEPVYVAGSDNAEELARAEKAIERLRREADAGLYDDDEDGYIDRLKRLTERKRHLQSQPSRPAHWRREGLGETYAEAWERLDTAGRQSLLDKAGVKVYARARPFVADFQVNVEALRELIPEFNP